MIQKHGGDGNGFDDHHAGGCRESPQKRQQGQPGVAALQRQIEDKIVGAQDAAAVKDSAKCNRYDEKVDQEHIGREKPHCRFDMPFVRILDDGNMKLAGKEHDRPHGKPKYGEPVHMRIGTALVYC